MSLSAIDQLVVREGTLGNTCIGQGLAPLNRFHALGDGVGLGGRLLCGWARTNRQPGGLQRRASGDPVAGAVSHATRRVLQADVPDSVFVVVLNA